MSVNQRFQNKLGNMDPTAFENNIRSSVTTNMINDNSKEIDRITKYSLYWKFYEGKHYNQANDAFLTFNYVRAFIDKVNQFLLGDDCFSLKVQGYYTDVVEEEIETNVEKLLMGVWRKNNHKRFTQEILQMTSVSGDSWVGAFYKESFGVELELYDSRKCFPVFKNGNFNDLESFEVRNTLDDTRFKISVTRYTKTTVETWKQENANSKGVKEADKFEYTKIEHGLGAVPIVHFKNKPTSSGYFAASDAEDLLKLNKIYNELHQEVKAIIDYHAAPTTVVTGATVKNMSKGIGKVWSGLPSEANVFNLGLDVDLTAVGDFMDRIKTAMHELSDIPEGVLGKLQSISGTSAAALKLTYQPIYQRAALKAVTYGESIRDLNNIILKYMVIMQEGKVLNNREAEFMAKIPKGFTDEYECVPVFTYGFPVDRMLVLQELQMELQMDLATIAEAMNRLGKKNVPELLAKIREDKIAKAQLEAEILAIAGGMGMGGNPTGTPPNPADGKVGTSKKPAEATIEIPEE